MIGLKMIDESKVTDKFCSGGIMGDLVFNGGEFGAVLIRYTVNHR